MPTTMQKEVLAALEHRLETDGFVVHWELSAANVGVLRAVALGQFTSLFPVFFDFQRDYATFKYQYKYREQPIKRDRTWRLDYERGEQKFTETLEELVQFLEGNQT